MTHLSQITDSKDQLAAERAMVFIGTHGGTCYAPERWTFQDQDDVERAYAFAETDYAPEWIPESDLGCDRDQCVTVVSCGWSEARIPAGYRIAYQYPAGECACPWCGGGTGDYEDSDGNVTTEETRRATCELCEQSGYIYDGDDCTIVVFAPRYSYGSGMSGCLFDNGPHFATSVTDAIDALVSNFDGYFETLADAENDTIESGEPDYNPAAEETAMRAALASDGIFRFTHPELAGADYCEITDMS